MGRSRLSINVPSNVRPTVSSDRRKQTDMSLEKFFQLHEKFLHYKTLEGLAFRTMRDHRNHMLYFRRYTEVDNRSEENRWVNIDLLRGYVAYMISEKKFKQCTINVRLRTLKCYCKWLLNEGHTEIDYSSRIKLMKVPEDTIKPLSDANVRKMLKAPDKQTYHGFRDFVLMVLMLDCGVRVNEAINIQVSDVDLKLGLINIRPENAKTRIARQLPVSSKTCRLLKELIEVANKNKSQYVFQSSLGGQTTTDNIISHFIRYGKKAKVGVRSTPHVFRHTFATNFIKAGGDIFTLQKILGHSTLAMCRKYIQLDSSDLIKKHGEAGLLDNYLN